MKKCPHIKLKRKTFNSILHLLRPLLKSKHFLSNKLTIYLQLGGYRLIIQPVWIYRMAYSVIGSTKPCNTKTLQAKNVQSICL